MSGENARAREKFQRRNAPCAPEDLASHYHYEPASGVLYRKRGPSLRRLWTLDGGYIVSDIYRQKVRAHRIIWAMHYGEWPKGHVDHINGDRTDNRLSNLRLATNAQNQQNAGLSPRNKSGFKGVSYYKPLSKWRAIIGIDGKRKHLGYFDTPEAAHARYAQAAREVYGEFARPAYRAGPAPKTAGGEGT